jgi:peptidoglycan/xylan/chitin deacetylase (PgdA/CDA1 family)
MSPSTSILTYHSQNILGQATSDNDHVALREDLQAITSAGYRIISLGTMMDCIEKGDAENLHNSICLTFDDGCDFDVQDIDYPGHGVQRSFKGILEDFIGAHGENAQPSLHATTFVIASPDARRIIDERSLFGKSWISDHWWQEIEEAKLISIGNHGWDHNHPDLADDGSNRGGFHSVDTLEQCQQQVIQAAEYIQSTTGTWPEFFAYPFGESSAYIRQEFFPGDSINHRCIAALGTDPGKVHQQSDRWNLPRYVCGRDWKTPQQLLGILSN